MNISGSKIKDYDSFYNPQNWPEAFKNPIVRNATRMLQSGDVDGLKNMAENLMKERGIDENQMLQMIKDMTSKH